MKSSKLILIEPRNAKKDILIAGSLFLIGRAADCQLVLDYPGVSKYHICIRSEGEHFTIEDLQSQSGTKVNEKSISRQLLKDGDVITIPGVELRFQETAFEEFMEESQGQLQEEILHLNFDALLHGMPDAVIATNEKNTIVDMNPAAEKLTGWIVKEALGKNLFEVFQTTRDGSKDNADGSSVPGAKEYSLLIDRNGSRTPIDCHTVSLRDDKNGITGYCIVFGDVSERKAADDALRESRERLRQLVNSIDGIIWEADVSRGLFTFVSKQAVQILGYAVKDWLSKPDFWRNHLFPEDANILPDREKHILARGKNYQLQYRMVAADGNIVWFKDLVSVVTNANKVVRLRGVMEDITVQKGAEQRLLESEQSYRTLVESAPDMIYRLSVPSGIITTLNPAFEKNTGLRAEDFQGKSFLSLVHPDDITLAMAQYNRILSGEIVQPVELRFQSGSGEYLTTEVTGRPAVKNGVVARVTWIARDITERKRTEEKLLRYAFYDVLTGLPNRALFFDRLGHSINRAKRRGRDGFSFAVLFLDLDRFKVVNDSLGHMMGDDLLIQTARRLEQCVRPDDTVARIGGDEFVILLENVHDAREVINVAERIQKESSILFNLSGHEVFTSVSIGISLSSPRYDCAEEMLRDADTAMYRAKSLGRARYQVFDSAMRLQAMSLLEMETDLRNAVERQEFCLYYQPIVSLASFKPIGFEALVRWHHPRRGLLRASEFIPLAEETGLIEPVGRFVIEEACRQISEWKQELGGDFPGTVSINLSARQFKNPNLVDQITDVLKKTEVPSSNLTLEITESVLMETGSAAERMLQELHDKNMKLQIDDFGTGYSSLGYLKRFPVDALKIDRSFVQSMNENSEILQSVVGLAQSLDLEVIAEGIETKEQATTLTSLGCGYGQGYYFSTPLHPSGISQGLYNGSLPAA